MVINPDRAVVERFQRKARERFSCEEVEKTRHRKSRTPLLSLVKKVNWPLSRAITRRRMLSTISRSLQLHEHRGTGAINALELRRSIMPREVCWIEGLPMGSSHTGSGGRFTMARNGNTLLLATRKLIGDAC